MTTVRNEHTPTFRDRNTELFHQRQDLLAELGRVDTADADTDADTSTDPGRCSERSSTGRRRRVRMLRRKLDDVTSEIVRYNMGLVRSYTRRFTSNASADDRAEFESAGLLGLMRAIDSYDPESGAFGQWAFKPIQREVLRSVRDVDHSNLSLGDFEKRPAILRTYRQLKSLDEAYEPSDEEVAAVAGVPVAQVRRVLAPPTLESMHQRIGGEDGAELGDTIETDEPTAEARVMSMMTLAALETFGLPVMDSRELYVIVRRFGLDGEPAEKLADIGVALDLSREAVRQIESKALAKLQHPLVLRKLTSNEINTPVAARA